MITICLAATLLQPRLQPVWQDSAQEDKKQVHRFIQDRAFQLDKLKQETCKIGKHVFHLWVMDTDAKRQEGLMFVKDTDMKDNEGMIFIFPNEDYRRFWMRNTLIDLDITYNDKDGRILNFYTMKALDETTDYSSSGPAMSVIELKPKTLKKLEIQAGDKWEIPESVVAKDGN